MPDKRLPDLIASDKRARINTYQKGKTPGSDSSSTNKLDAWIAAAFNDLLGNLRPIGEKDGIEQLVIGWNSQINRDHASHQPPFRLGRPTFDMRLVPASLCPSNAASIPAIQQYTESPDGFTAFKASQRAHSHPSYTVSKAVRYQGPKGLLSPTLYK